MAKAKGKSKSKGKPMQEIHAWVSVGKDGIRVSPDPIRVPRGKFKIVWEILWPPKANFHRPGIKILHSGLPFQNFTFDQRRVTVENHNDKGARGTRAKGRYTIQGYKYLIKIARPGKKPIVLDPAIENDNS